MDHFVVYSTTAVGSTVLCPSGHGNGSKSRAADHGFELEYFMIGEIEFQLSIGQVAHL